MYDERVRTALLERLTEEVESKPCYEGLCQTGTGAGNEGYRDSLSHASATICVENQELIGEAMLTVVNFLKDLGADYIHQQSMGKGYKLEAFWHGGLSVVLQVTLSAQFSVKANEYRILCDKHGHITQRILSGLAVKDNVRTDKMDYPQNYEFCYALRRFRMQWQRKNYIASAIMLGDAVRVTLNKAMQLFGVDARFAQYEKLPAEFLTMLQDSVPKAAEKDELMRAEKALYNLYTSTLRNAGESAMDPSLHALYDFDKTFAGF